MNSTQAIGDLTERLRREMEASAAVLQSVAKDSTVNSTQAIGDLTERLRREMEASASALQSAAKDFDRGFGAGRRRPDRTSAP